MTGLRLIQPLGNTPLRCPRFRYPRRLRHPWFRLRLHPRSERGQGATCLALFDKLGTLDSATLTAISNFIEHLKSKPDRIGEARQIDQR